MVIFKILLIILVAAPALGLIVYLYTQVVSYIKARNREDNIRNRQRRAAERERRARNRL